MLGVRVTLMHVAQAGPDHHSARDLIDEIERAGHRVVAHATRRSELRVALEHATDVVAVAGGDGTIGKVAKVLRGTGIPFVVIPVGTANNIATTLGVDGLDWWQDAEVRSYDVARAHFDGEQQRFIEALGCGAFPRVIHQTRAMSEPYGDKLERDLRLFRNRIVASPLKDYRIDADGRDVSGTYFLVEALNISHIGPRIPLAPAASPSDGALDLVLAGADDRPSLLAAVEAIARGETPALTLRTVRARRIRIAGTMRRCHLDGDLRDRSTRAITVAIEPGALRVLTPKHPRG